MIDEKYYHEEDYVSEDIAKLLKDKGFHWKVFERKYYPKDPFDPYDSEGIYAPTVQTTMKWLREVHHLYITVAHTFSPNSDVSFYYCINVNIGEEGEWSTYEQACEAAIKYCLKYLI